MHMNVCMYGTYIGWATSVAAGSWKGGKGFMFFDIVVDLTNEGEGNFIIVCNTVKSVYAVNCMYVYILYSY